MGDRNTGDLNDIGWIVGRVIKVDRSIDDYIHAVVKIGCPVEGKWFSPENIASNH